MRSRMFKAGLAGACTVALTLGLTVGGATAGPNAKQFGKLAAKDCQQQRKALGKQTFRETYGKPAMPRCIGVTKPVVREETRNASQECREERQDMGVEPFREEYGTNKNNRNAFGKCVSGKRRAALREERKEIVNAAKECKAERDEMGVEAFRAEYGTNGNSKNAFGKCVSSKAKAADEEPETPETPETPEQPEQEVTA